MTAVRAAGYTTAGNRPGTGARMFDPMGGGQPARGPAPPLLKRADNSPEDKCREMERDVNGLIEESARLALDKKYQAALDRAKEAGKLERQLCKKREEHGLSDQINIDLTCAQTGPQIPSLCIPQSRGARPHVELDFCRADSVCFNLANQHHCCGMYLEALNAYSLIVKNKQYAQSGRLRVNVRAVANNPKAAGQTSLKACLFCDALWPQMGNIYYEQKKFSAAIKMYRMALDQIPNTGREIRCARTLARVVSFCRVVSVSRVISLMRHLVCDCRFKIMRNIGNAFVRLGQFQDAIASFEQIMDGSPDVQTGFNLVLCYYAAGEKVFDKERWKSRPLCCVGHLTDACLLFAGADEEGFSAASWCT